MLILGIDPGSSVTGWALLKADKNKVHYLGSGILKFTKEDFLDRLTDIKVKIDALVKELSPDEVALESLIYVKSPTALIKLAQARGIILSSLVMKYKGKIFEYSPNLVKSSAVGHGHADKESVQKVLNMLLGERDYESHDESDAVAVALCHFLNRGKVNNSEMKTSKGASRSLSSSLAHKLRKI